MRVGTKLATYGAVLAAVFGAGAAAGAAFGPEPAGDRQPTTVVSEPASGDDGDHGVHEG